MNLHQWISENTKDSQCVVEFGSMFFDKLSHVSSKKKIGIEIWLPYITASRYHNCEKIHGDFTKFESLIKKEDMECAMFIDTLEHITREEAFDLMARVMKSFNKIILMIPEGEYPLEKDVTGMGADYYQTHKSIWNVEDVKQLGFKNIIVDPYFHAGSGYPNTGCIFAVWNKNE
jgi:hypothetical protein